MENLTKKICSFALAAGMAVSSISMATAADVRYKGDIDNNGSVDSNDALGILMDIVSGEDSKLDLKLADLDLDSAITTKDALAVLQTVIGQLEPVPVEEEEEEDPVLKYSKEEIVKFYNDALKKSYSQKVKIDKDELTDIKISDMKPSAAKSLVNSIISSNAKTEKSSETIDNCPSYAATFLVPAELEANGVSVVSISKSENGYKVEIKLVEEKVDYKTAPKFNTQASNPVTGIKEIADDSGATINKMDFDYLGTEIEAEIDSDGKVLSLKHTMPMTFEADCNASIFHITAKGSGTYTLNAKLTY